MRLHAQTALIENGFVYIPEAAPWLAEYLHELTVFPNGKHDDQVDGAIPRLVQNADAELGHFEYYRQRAEEAERLRGVQPVQPQWTVGSMEWLAEQNRTS